MDLDPCASGCGHELATVGRLQDERLLDKDVESAGDRGSRDRMVIDVRRGDHDSIQVGFFEHDHGVREGRVRRESPLRTLEVRPIGIGDGREVRVGVGLDRGEVRRVRPVARPGDRDPDRHVPEHAMRVIERVRCCARPTVDDAIGCLMRMAPWADGRS